MVSSSQSSETQLHHHRPPFRLTSPNKSHRQGPSQSITRTQSIVSPMTNDKQAIAEGSIRYLQTPHGFELQRYWAKNWLTIDVVSKEACRNDDRSFREMIAKKHRAECLSESIYTSAYYRERWYQLLQSYRQGHLTHEEWAKQNYQLYCLKQYYLDAAEREQLQQDQINDIDRRLRAQNAFDRWKEMKNEATIERQRSRLNTAQSQRTINPSSILSTPIPSVQPEYLPPEPNPAAVDSSQKRDSMTNNDMENSFLAQFSNRQRPSLIPPMVNINEQNERWSVSAMLKRIVGLAEPVPSNKPKKVSSMYTPVTKYIPDRHLPPIRI